MREQEAMMEGMPPIKRPRKVVKKHHTTKNVPVEVSIRRQVSFEIGDGEPTKDEKFTLLQKYGVVEPRIDRQVTKPNWKGIKQWKKEQNDWFLATKGLVSPQQRPRFTPKSSNTQTAPRDSRTSNHKPWSQIKFKNPQAQQRHNQRNRHQSTNPSRPNSAQTRTETRQN